MSDKKEKNEPSECSAAEAARTGKEAEEDAALRENMARIGNKIIVLSGKGGVGKSTVAVNLAISLAEKKYRTGLLDIDIHGPSVPNLLGLEEKDMVIMSKEQIMPVEYNEYLKVVSIGFLIHDYNEPVIWRGPLKYSVIKQFLKDVVWGDLDYLVIDSPPGTGDEPLSICQLIANPKGAVVVTTPQDIALIDVRKSVTFCNKLNLPVIGVVENMSGFVCPHCGKETDIFKTGGGSNMASDMGIPFLGSIPIEPRIVTDADKGIPFYNKESNKTIAQIHFAQIAEKIIEGVKK